MKQARKLSFLAYLPAGLLAALFTTGCASLSSVTPQGTTDKPVFPEPASATFTNGSWPNADNLRQMQPGMTKNQIYNLLDHPHFDEGIGAREWDYLFHLRTANGETVCQYKILFDDKKLARSFFWKPTSCGQIINAAQ